jgi:hemin uptake protein HemP
VATARPSGIAAAADPARKVVRSQELFAGSSQVDIQHGEAIYRLRITALGKLILTK